MKASAPGRIITEEILREFAHSIAAGPVLPYAFRSNETTFTTILASVLWRRGYLPTCEKAISIQGKQKKPDLLVLERPAGLSTVQELVPLRDRGVVGQKVLGAYEVKVTYNPKGMQADVQKLQGLAVQERALLILDIHWPYQFEKVKQRWRDYKAALRLNWLEPQTAECRVDIEPPFPVAFATAGFVI